MSRMRVWSLLAMAALGDGLLGCDLSCDKESPHAEPVAYTGGRVTPDGTWYETNGWNEDYVRFPAGRRIAIEHGLGAEPTAWFTYLAFERRPLVVSNTAESAGNQAVVEHVDDRIVIVRNDTCQDFFLRFAATLAPGLVPGGAGGAPGDGGASGN